MPSLFAEISDAVWLGLIGLVAMVVKELLDRSKVERVASKIDEATDKHRDHEQVSEDVSRKVADNSAKLDAISERLGGGKNGDGQR